MKNILTILLLIIPLALEAAPTNEAVTINSSTGAVINTPAVNFPTNHLKLNGSTLESTFQLSNSVLSDVAGLSGSLQQGDVLWYDSGHLVRLGHGSGGVLMSTTDIMGSWSVGWGSSAVTINGQMA